MEYLKNSYIHEIKDIIKIDEKINFAFDLTCEATVLGDGEMLCDLIKLIKFKEVRLVKIQLGDISTTALDETLEDEFYLKFARDEKTAVEVNCTPEDTLRQVTAKLSFVEKRFFFDGEELTDFSATLRRLELNCSNCTSIINLVSDWNRAIASKSKHSEFTELSLTVNCNIFTCTNFNIHSSHNYVI